MRIDRAVDWSWPQKPQIMDFIDFGGPINLVMQLDVDSKGKKEIPKPEEVDFSEIQPFKATKVYPSIEDNRARFEHERENWLEEPKDSTAHLDIKPDHLFWYALKSDCDYEKDKTNMRFIIRMVFKEK
jgi:hypothetical protein